ncbi:MAG: glycosyltransferase family 2 protein [Chitinophagaceae bacterium]
MQLSIIIVNYNVKYFLEHCLLSVFRACEGMQAEVFVVDNASVDGSVDMVRTQFPQAICIANTENVGFAKANNQAVALAKGEYILYLNPDTILPEDSLLKCYAYMQAHPEAGALGCRLVDGKGEFLPESKRGFPSAAVAFYKISGLSGLFPRSRRFNQYHLGYLSEHETHTVDVLVGCFMFCRKAVIDAVGSFDETYFMYGEDIDLSYRIKQAGFENVYFPDTTVIHYKGESTKKGSLNYVRMFYQAMIIFAKKHFSSSQKQAFVFLIQCAIYFRALLALVIRVFDIVKLPLLDAGTMLLALWSMKQMWVTQVKTGTVYAPSLLWLFFVGYILTWTGTVFLSGGYDKPYKASRLMRGMLWGGLITLAIYGLLPETVRFSRGITVLGALSATLLMLLWRALMQAMGVEQVSSEQTRHQRVLLVSNAEGEQAVRDLWQQAHIEKQLVGRIEPGTAMQAGAVGTLSELPWLARVYQASEIIYVQQQLSFKAIIDSMQQTGSAFDYKLHGLGTDSIIGSNSKNTAGDLYTTDIRYALSEPGARRNKRLADIGFSFLGILLFPMLAFVFKQPITAFGNLLQVFIGRKTWIGYENRKPFPYSKPYLISIGGDYLLPHDERQIPLIRLYAREYTVQDDMQRIWKGWRSL